MKGDHSITPKNIDDYIARQPEEFRPTLEKLRTIIRSLVPQAEESISYQVACFKYRYMLVGIGANKNYCSLYTMSPSLASALKKEFKEVKISGATIHLPPSEPLPVALIKKIVKTRVKENEAKYSQKSKI